MKKRDKIGTATISVDQAEKAGSKVNVSALFGVFFKVKKPTI